MYPHTYNIHIHLRAVERRHGGVVDAEAVPRELLLGLGSGLAIPSVSMITIIPSVTISITITITMSSTISSTFTTNILLL